MLHCQVNFITSYCTTPVIVTCIHPRTHFFFVGGGGGGLGWGGGGGEPDEKKKFNRPILIGEKSRH